MRQVSEYSRKTGRTLLLAVNYMPLRGISSLVRLCKRSSLITAGFGCESAAGHENACTEARVSSRRSLMQKVAYAKECARMRVLLDLGIVDKRTIVLTDVV